MYLNCHTYYSLRYGTFSEVELLELARKNQVTRLALTDINNTSAGLNFVRKAQEYGVDPVLGIDFRNGVVPCFVGLARNNNGYQELNTFLSKHLHEEKPIPSRAPRFDNAFVVYPFEHVQRHNMDHFLPHEYIGVSLKDMRRLPFSRYGDYRKKLVLLQSVT
ncbi:MAG: PHP domain-containing protein, partial [Eudoraea sp.]|nr:PHP domain-containing protein [Eudoraea sp.]